MQLIIPLAGKGTRLRPHTHTKPKPLLHVAGKPILGHILDTVQPLGISKAVFITGDMSEQITEFVSGYKFESKFIKQEQLLGDGQAISLAKDEITEDVLIVFVDTIFEADLSVISSLDGDGMAWVSEVDDPKRFGIVSKDDTGKIVGIIEKPEEPPTNLALIGLYYLKDSKKLFSALDELVKREIKSKGEYRLADALSLMIEKGDVIKAETVTAWEDCGKPETLLLTNRHLLEKNGGKVGKTKNSVIIQPVFIEDDAEVKDSVIGPNVSIAAGAKIERSVLSDSIIGRKSTIKNANLAHTLVGSDTVVHMAPKKLNIGDHSTVHDD